MMVGPEAEATALVRHASRLLVAGAALRVPVRRGDPAPRLRARRAGDDRPGACTSRCSPWHGRVPTSARWASRARSGWGCARSSRRSRDEDEREQRVREVTAAAQENAKALNAATLFELDDVIDPAETRR